MDTLERATVYTAVNIAAYGAGTLETARIMSKTTGSVTMMAVDAGVNTGNKVSPFDTLVYILEGKADITIDSTGHHLTSGEFIVIPAHFTSYIGSTEKFKMLVTIIKSGYED